MPVTFLNGTASGSNAVIFDTKMVTALYYMIDYTKGNESKITLSFETLNDKHPSASISPIPSGAFFSTVLVTAGSAAAYTIDLVSTGRYCIPVTSPESSDLMMATITFTGGTTGTAIVFIASDNKYS